MNTDVHNRIIPVVLLASIIPGLCAPAIRADEVLPVGNAPRALEFPWFPDRLHAFVWRNWELVDLPRLAKVLGTTPENVQAIGESMGLPPHVPPTDQQWRRGYITLIRRNWHLLPYEQLLELLDWTPHRLSEALREDDFLFIKLGSLKPACEPLRYTEPTAEARRRAAEIKAFLQREIGEELHRPARPRFEFVEQLSAPLPGQPLPPADDDAPIRMIYSYFAVYGDPLSDPALDPYPDGLLQRLAQQGVNAVWMHTVLRDLAPSSRFPEFGTGHETRLENLRRLVQRAKKYGIRVILYMNEPRSLPPAFFKKHPEIAGAPGRGNVAMCTSVPEVRQWLSESLAYVFRNVPDLGGVFTITASENLTSCASLHNHAACPRCSKREGAEIIAEVNRTIAAGVHQGNPNARVIVWDWGWPDDWAEAIIQGLPQDVLFMSVSEWSLPITRGGVASRVGEYSLSAVGPGPRATRHWKLAQDRGLRVMAKVQMNCTWELSAVPWLPVLDLVARHCDNLRTAGVRDLMLSWTLGGYPSPNLQVAREFARQPDNSADQILDQVAQQRYGNSAVTPVREAWSAFSQAFTEFPYNGTVLYAGPHQSGPANPLYLQPTGYGATMVGIPYDDLTSWRAIYPAEVLADQFAKVAGGWAEGLNRLRDAQSRATGQGRQHLDEDVRLAEAALTHFQSAANQVRFVMTRNALLETKPDDPKRKELLSRMRECTADEMIQAHRLYLLTKQDPRIGFEASNHYYYLPTDLLEKLINCAFVLDQIKKIP